MLGGWPFIESQDPRSQGFQPQCLGRGNMPQGSSKVGKKAGDYNSSAWRTRGWWDVLATMVISTPQTLAFLLSAQVTGLGTREHDWGGGGAGGTRLRFWRLLWLKPSAKPFLPEGDGSSEWELLSFPAQPQAPPNSLAGAIRGLSLCTPIHWLAPHLSENWVGLSLMPPLSSAELSWLLITHGLYYFSFVL